MTLFCSKKYGVKVEWNETVSVTEQAKEKPAGVKKRRKGVSIYTYSSSIFLNHTVCVKASCFLRLFERKSLPELLLWPLQKEAKWHVASSCCSLQIPHLSVSSTTPRPVYPPVGGTPPSSRLRYRWKEQETGGSKVSHSSKASTESKQRWRKPNSIKCSTISWWELTLQKLWMAIQFVPFIWTK